MIATLPQARLTDEDFDHLVSPEDTDETIAWMVETGWTLGRTQDGWNEFWPPENEIA